MKRGVGMLDLMTVLIFMMFIVVLLVVVASLTADTGTRSASFTADSGIAQEAYSSARTARGMANLITWGEVPAGEYVLRREAEPVTVPAYPEQVWLLLMTESPKNVESVDAAQFTIIPDMTDARNFGVPGEDPPHWHYVARHDIVYRILPAQTEVKYVIE